MPECLHQFSFRHPNTGDHTKTMTITTINTILTVIIWAVLISNILTAVVMQVTLLVMQTKKGDLDPIVKLRYREAITVHLAWSILALLLIK